MWYVTLLSSDLVTELAEPSQRALQLIPSPKKSCTSWENASSHCVALKLSCPQSVVGLVCLLSLEWRPFKLRLSAATDRIAHLPVSKVSSGSSCFHLQAPCLVWDGHQPSFWALYFMFFDLIQTPQTWTHPHTTWLQSSKVHCLCTFALCSLCFNIRIVGFSLGNATHESSWPMMENNLPFSRQV